MWHTLIATTEKMASGRQKVADNMLDKIAEESKQHRKEKEAAFKRVSGFAYSTVCIKMCILAKQYLQIVINLCINA